MREARESFFYLICLAVEMFRQSVQTRLVYIHSDTFGQIALNVFEQSVARGTSQMLELELFEICAHFAFLFQPEQMFFPSTLHGSANLILFEKNYYVLMKTYKNFQIFCFLMMEVHSKNARVLRKAQRKSDSPLNIKLSCLRICVIR